MDVSSSLKHNRGMKHHHAYVCFGNSITVLSLPEAYRMPTSDVSHVAIDSFGIDDARSLTTQSFQKPLVLDKRVFIIVARQLTSEAQNALLKLFEEPPEQAIFYLVVPKEGVLLPTLRSRLFVLTSSDDGTDKNDAFTSFLSASYAKRLEHIALLVKEKDEETIEVLLYGAEQYAEAHAKTNTVYMESLLLVRSYIGMRGASSKMLLEELAISLPQK